MRLIIAEKQIAARRIAEILSDGSAKILRENKIQVYQIDDENFVLPLRGHVLNVDYPRQYNNWISTNLHSLVHAPLEYSPSEPTIVKVLKKYAPRAREVVISTDFDTEGESIGREAVKIISEKNQNIKVKRARFSAITQNDVLEAFKKLNELDYNLADSADARREIDLIWGAVLTRFVSLSSGRLGSRFLSVGRVQTPTLALIVNLEKKREAFKPEPFWVLTGIFYKEFEFKAVHEKDKFWNEDEAKRVFEKVKGEKKGTVIKTSSRKKKIEPPIPFNTTGFLRAAGNIGFSPARAMNIAETLYMRGLISYPRTDNTVYPSSVNLKEIVGRFSNHSDFGKYAKSILNQPRITPTRGSKRATDHPPIMPVEVASKEKLSSQEWRIYSLIVRRFLATLSPPCELEVVKAKIRVRDEIFIANGQVILKPGWVEAYPYSRLKESRLPKLSEGEEILAKSFILEEKKTQPPARYTPASLIKEMETLNLGTKSTRPEIIKKLQQRQYIRGARSYEPTHIAFALIDALEKHAPEITKPDMTAKLEKEMELIQKGSKKKDEVVEDSRKMLEKVLAKLTDNHEEIGKSLKEAAGKTESFGKCKCGGDLRLIVSKRTHKRFVGCSNYEKGCRVSYPLPQRGVVIPTGKTCPKCGAPVVKIRYKRTYEMCLNPNCETKKNWKRAKKV